MRNTTNIHGDDVIEIMAEVRLRDVLGVVGGDNVLVSVADADAGNPTQ